MSRMYEPNSLRDSLLSLNKEERFFLLQNLTEAEAEAVLRDWRGIWARPNQVAPDGEWLDWLLLAGRGYGKTRTGAEWCIEQIQDMPGSRGAVVASTWADARSTCMEGESGLIASLPSHLMPPHGGQWISSIGQLKLANGSQVQIYTSEKPGRLRGPQHHWAWCDELAQWKKGWAAWDNLKFGLRLPWKGKECRTVTSTTPLPIKIIRDLRKSPTTITTTGSTYENLPNLSSVYRSIIAKYEGTSLGRQELNAEILEDTPGALWSRASLEAHRVDFPPLQYLPNGKEEFDFVYVVVAIDPAATSGEDADETGIIVAAKAGNGHRYVLEDLSGCFKPHEWASISLDAYHRWKADRIVAEVNNGGEMVEATIKAEAKSRTREEEKTFAYKAVHASRGKYARAEPIATAYERGQVHHVGLHEKLEDQLCTWIPGLPMSPDRLDACVWALTELQRGMTTFE